MNSQIDTEALITDLKAMVRDSEQLLQSVAGASGEKAEALRERLAQAVTAAQESCKIIESTARQKLAAADETIRDHPYQSIGVALAAGVVLGVLLARK